MHYYSDGPISIARGLLRCFFARVLLSNATKKRAKVLQIIDLCKFFGKKIYFFYYKYRFWLSFLSITEYTTVTAMLWIEDIGQFDTYG